jgi:hypothetical protein
MLQDQALPIEAKKLVVLVGTVVCSKALVQSNLSDPRNKKTDLTYETIHEFFVSNAKISHVKLTLRETKRKDSLKKK